MWTEGETDGYRWYAKVYDVGSGWGIDGGRVSKLSISDSGDTEVYNYDRGLDFDNAPAGLVAKILALFPDPEGGA